MPSTRAFRSDERGQVLIIVGAAFAALLLAAALALDWGFALTQRRVMQNAADAGAVAAGQLLVRVVFPGPLFAVTENQVFCEALDYVRANEENFGTVLSDPKARPTDLRVQWADVSKSPFHDLVAYSSWPPAPPGIDCSRTTVGPLDRNGGPAVNAAARFIRVETSTTFRAILAGRPVTAGASATAFIHGTNVPADGPFWPITRHYTRAIFNESCGNPCSPQQATPVTFWSSGGGKEIADVDYNTFHGMVDYSRYSMLIADGRNCYAGATVPGVCEPQLIGEYDNSGPPAAPIANQALAVKPKDKCAVPGYGGNDKWITWGDDLAANDDTSCSVPNWASKPFGVDPSGKVTSSAGRLHLDVNRGAEVDTDRPSVCSAANKPPAPIDNPPSCNDPKVGDWLETQPANTGQTLSAPLTQFIADHGVGDAWEHVSCGKCGGKEYGKHVVILVFLWDCAQDHSSGTWVLVHDKTNPDCADIHDASNLDGKVQRVHLFISTPFTFYAGFVNSSSIQGFWGGSVSDQTGTAVINEFANAVNLID